MSTYRPPTLVLFLAAVAIVLSACSSDSTPAATLTPAAPASASQPQAAGQSPAAAQQAGGVTSVPVVDWLPTALTPELCAAVGAWAEEAPTLDEQILENMRADGDTIDLRAAALVVEELDPTGDVGGFVAAWTLVMRDRQGFITAVGGPNDLYDTDIALYNDSLLEAVENIDTAAIKQRIETGCGVVVPVQP